MAVRRLDRARPSARSGRRRAPSAGARATRRRRARTRPSWPARIPVTSRASVPALPQSIGAAGALEPAQADAVDDAACRRRCSSTSTPERAHDAERRLGVARAAPAADERLAVGERADQQRAVRDRLVAGHADVPVDPRAARSHRELMDHHRAPPRRRRRSPAPRAARPPRRASPSPVTSSVSVPPRSGEMCWSSKSSMLIRSAPSACVIAASTPGRSGTWTRTRCSAPASGVGAARASGGGCRAASPIQRARKPASLAVERGLDLLDPAAVLGERLADRGRVVEEDVDPDPRVRAGDAGHVAQRAAGVRERLVALDARRARLVDEHVREHVRQVARQRDEPVVRGRVDRDRHGAELGDEAVHEPVAARGRSAAVGGQEPGRALEERRRGVLGAARLGAADRMAADEARRAAGRRDDARLRRADVGDGRLLARRREHRRDLRRQRRDRRRDDRELGAASASSSDAAASSTAPRSTAAASAAGSGSQPATRAPRSLRRQPDGGADQPGADDREPVDGHGYRAASARRGGTRGRATAARSGAGRRASRSGGRAAPRRASSEPPRHSVTSSPVYSRCTPPGQTPSARQAAKKPSISAMIASKWRVLRPPATVNTFACIGSQAQTTGCSGFAHRAQERRQQLGDALGAEARDQRQPARDAVGVEPLAELDHLLRRRVGPDLDAERVVHARRRTRRGRRRGCASGRRSRACAPSSRTSRRSASRGA